MAGSPAAHADKQEPIDTDHQPRDSAGLSPDGTSSADNFSLAQVTIEPPDDGHVLVRNLFMSVDPYMRGRMNDTAS